MLGKTNASKAQVAFSLEGEGNNILSVVNATSNTAPEAGEKVLLKKTEENMTDFTAFDEDPEIYTTGTLTGFTTGETDEDGKIKVATVLPPTLEITLTHYATTLNIEGDIES